MAPTKERPAALTVSAGRQPDDEQLPAVSSTSWQPPDDLSFSQWLKIGSRVGKVSRSSAWWLGDWLRFGTVKYGSRYKEATRVTGLDNQTLQNYAWVAGQFEISRRRETVSWSHHAELASLDPTEQDAWLDRIESEKLPVRVLRQELSRAAAEGTAPGGRSAARADQDHGADGGASGESHRPDSRAPATIATSAVATEGAGDDPDGPVDDETVRCPNCGTVI